MHILILEDDLVLAAELKKFLELEDYRVSAVHDGVSFLEEIQQSSFDFYLLDINVPKINGLDVCKIIREKDTETPIIIISA